MYRPGDIVLILFPFTLKNSQNLTETLAKLRPALIIEVSQTNSGVKVYNVCQITHTDRTGQFPGIWFQKGQKFFTKTGLSQNSFFNVTNRIDTTEHFIKQKIGYFVEMDKIKELIEK